ncbi:uncharacterized protein [Henckelia pumila]|uniref:uncharacterized protein n=1 Tax=Henckelia pumila TaxID=405737 RepID=UPI003C6DC095
MRRWLPRAAERKFLVAVKPTKLEGFPADDSRPETTHQKFACVRIKWRGEPVKFLPLIQRGSTRKKEFSSEEIWKKGHQIIVWDDDKWFENTCSFSVFRNHIYQGFGPWEIVLDILKVEKVGSKAKTAAVVGRVSVDIAEIAWKLEESCVERKVPVIFKIEGVDKEAFLTVLFRFAEIRKPQELSTVVSGRSIKSSKVGSEEVSTGGRIRRRKPSEEEVIDLGEPDEWTTFLAAEATSRSNTIPRIQQDSYKKQGWFSWNNRGLLSFKRAKTEDSTSYKTTESCSTRNRNTTAYAFSEPDSDPVLQDKDQTRTCLVSEDQQEESSTCAWEDGELVSRDGKTKVKAGVFFASFDQRSDEADGESACAALALVISHWLNLNKDEMPDRLEFDNLIKEGSSEWRKLCGNADLVRDFPNKHFDLETVLRADIRPVSVLHEKSFVGFFGADKFESLKGAMSFDEIWNEISGNAAAAVKYIGPSIYIVSWHEHFFVLKVEEKAYYIIDTLGERLFEGCNRAYVLKFDDSAVMMQIQADKETTNQPRTEDTNSEEATETEKIICSGKDCCREFIKRFLAAIPLHDLEEEEKTKGVSYVSLYRRLQIEFSYCCSPDSDTSSLISSIFSSPNTSASSSFTNEGFDPQF